MPGSLKKEAPRVPAVSMQQHQRAVGKGDDGGGGNDFSKEGPPPVGPLWHSQRSLATGSVFSCPRTFRSRKKRVCKDFWESLLRTWQLLFVFFFSCGLFSMKAKIERKKNPVQQSSRGSVMRSSVK